MNSQERLPIFVDPSHPQILEGLETWLRLGLINDIQVKDFSQQYLTCSIPQVSVVSTTQTSRISNFTETDFAPEEFIPPRRRITVRQTERQPNILTQFWQSFRDELSVRWLLFLGLFLVVVSSFVLAGTQWENFSKVGQYLVLWVYTIIFSGVGIWANRQANLSLTAKTLQTIAILLIPINFWAMDSFEVWASTSGRIIGLITSISLIGICYLQNRSHYSILFFFNFLGLSLLHWGWRIELIPLIAIYLGVIVTTFVLKVFLSARRFNQSEILPLQNNHREFILYALAVLLTRAIFIFQPPLKQLGLALGIFGWIIPQQQEYRDNIPPFLAKILEVIGAILLLIGWWIAINDNIPWQTVIISGLFLQFLFYRLKRSWSIGDLLAIFIVGFQTLLRIRDLLPQSLKEISVNLWMQLTDNQFYYPSIYSVTLFIYIIIWLGFIEWLYAQNKPKLVNFGECLALGLGIILTLMALGNKVGLSLNLCLSTATLSYVLLRRRPIRVSLLYFTHLIGLITICSVINNLFPNLEFTTWAIILLVLMVGEWGLSTLQTTEPNPTLRQHWYRSCWYLGFLLAAISYVLLWLSLNQFFFNRETQYKVLAWLLTPLTLTGVATYSQENRRQNAITLSSYSLLMSQFLTIWQPEVRIVSLWIGVGIMLVNSFRICQLFAARLQVGFTVAAILVSIWEQFFKADEVLWIFFRDNNWILVNAIILTSLWLLSLALKQREQLLSTLFAKAVNEWAIILGIWNLLQLTLHSINVLLGFMYPSWQLLLSCLLIGTILTYRYWKQPNNLAVYGIIWTIELLIIESVLWQSKDLLNVATINLIVAFLWFGLTTWLLAKFTHLSHLTSLKITPLFFAVLGIFWRLGEFNEYTAGLTFGAAIVGIGVSQRLRQGKFLTYLSLIGISLAVYEWVIYQMLQQGGKNISAAIMILSLVTISIGIVYRFVAWWWQKKNYQSMRNINLADLYHLAHGHWGIAVILKIISGILAVNSLSFNPFLLVFSLVTALYALLQAKNPSHQQNSWVYWGLLDAYATGILARLIWAELNSLDPYYGAIVCGMAFFLYYLPWRQWGWNVTPWRRMALIFPTLTAFLSFFAISYFSLGIVAVFYGQIALKRENFRWSYVSLIFVDWAILRFLWEKNLTDILYYASVIGLSILYIAWIDSTLRQPNNYRLRHYWRIVGSGIICVTAMLFYQKTGLTPGIISLVTIFTGLGLKIRAFLYVGTITFILTVCYQLIILIGKYAFLKWVIGLIVGIILITIAANFERRREQMLSLLQNWTDRFNEWQ